MKISICTALLCLYVNVAFSQKPKPVSKPQPAAVSKATAAPLKPEDHKYYILVSRGTGKSEQTPLTYPANTYWPSPLLLLNINTMQEVTWWPELPTVRIGQELYIQEGSDYRGNGERLLSFTDTGKLRYDVTLSSQLAGPFNGNGLTISDDYKHVYMIANNDLWVGNLDITSGKVTNERQVTATGLLSKKGKGYMANNMALVNRHMINIDTKQQEFIGFNEVPTTSPYFMSMRGLGTDFVIWDITKQQVVYPFKNAPDHNMFWLDRAHTRFLRYKEYPRLSKEEAKTESPEQRKRRKEQEAKFMLEVYNVATTESTPVDWQNLVFEIFNPGMASLQRLTYTWSPSGRKFFSHPKTPMRTNDRDPMASLYMHDIETLKEEPLLAGSDSGWENLTWTDDEHLLFAAKEGTIVNGERISTMNQGTYIINVNTKQTQKLTPFLLSIPPLTNLTYTEGDRSPILKLVEAGRIVFEANNFLFSCKMDGSDIKQLTKQPDVYHLKKIFIDSVHK